MQRLKGPEREAAVLEQPCKGELRAMLPQQAGLLPLSFSILTTTADCLTAPAESLALKLNNPRVSGGRNKANMCFPPIYFPTNYEQEN